MLLTDRRATVRLHFALFYRSIIDPIETLSGYLSESPMSNLRKHILRGDHSMTLKVGTGNGQSLASD